MSSLIVGFQISAWCVCHKRLLFCG